jgi:amino acid adenylation domain-containing protein
VSSAPALLQEIIERSAERFPEREAFRCRDQSLSYAALQAKSCQLANLLIDLGVQPGDRVGLFCGKSIELPVAVFGTLAAGAAYVPLDPTLPPARVESLLADCGITVLITDPHRIRALQKINAELSVAIGLAEDADPRYRCIDWETVFTQPEQKPEVEVDPGSLAYIIYTSGSTGEPKGIMHTHSSAMAFAQAAALTYSLTESDRLSNFPPLHFDQSIFDFFSGPLAGSCTVIITEDVMRFSANLAELIEHERLTVWYSVPMPLTKMMLDGVLAERDLSSVRWILYGGETYPPKYLRQLLGLFPSATISNVYGPAETNQCTFFNISTLDEVPDEGLPIGPPWQWATVRVVDPSDVRGPAVREGELLVCSPTMMAGYWGGRFPEVFVDIEEGGVTQRYYRTGDIVHQDAGGQLFFRGRNDRLIKSRGQRIDLDDVESTLSSLDGVAEAATYTAPGDDGSAQIYAAMTPADGFSSERKILLTLQSLLSPAAIPVQILVLDEFPRTTSGKIDRRALATLLD